jgi:hypothetical protein
MNKKAIKLLLLLRDRQLTRTEIADSLHEDIAAVNDMIELLHTRFQYIKLTIVNDSDIISAEPPVPKYTLTLAGRAYLLAASQTVLFQFVLAVVTFTALASSISIICSTRRKKSCTPGSHRECCR